MLKQTSYVPPPSRALGDLSARNVAPRHFHRTAHKKTTLTFEENYNEKKNVSFNGNKVMTITSHIYLWSPEVTRRHHSCAFHCFLGHHLVNMAEPRNKGSEHARGPSNWASTKTRNRSTWTPHARGGRGGRKGGTNILSRNELGISWRECLLSWLTLLPSTILRVFHCFTYLSFQRFAFIVLLWMW
jgi:hypothetical protein